MILYDSFFRVERRKIMATKKNTTSTEAEIMQLLTENSDKLKILLSASKDDKPLKYKFKGKKSTKQYPCR